jgi:hypothetical protein
LQLISDKTSGTAISITGVSSSNYGVVFNYENPKEVLATGGGDIVITGTAGGNYGLFFQNTDVLSTVGTITANGGTRGITTPSGMRLASRSGTANVLLIGDTFNFGGATPVLTSGTVKVQPFGTSFSSAQTFTNATYGSAVSELTLGKPGNTADITIGSAVNVAGPVSVYGGNITVNNSLTSTASSADILLKATGNITSISDVNYTTNAGDITFWSDSDGSGAGYIYVYDRNIIDSRTSANRTSSLISTASGGGTITLGGGSASTTLASGTVVPTGYAVDNSGAAPAGVALGYHNVSHNSGTALYSGGGDITVRGKSTGSWSGDSTGIKAIEGLTMDAGTTGDITLDGAGGNAGATYSSGIYLNYLGSAPTVGALLIDRCGHSGHQQARRYLDWQHHQVGVVGLNWHWLYHVNGQRCQP